MKLVAVLWAAAAVVYAAAPPYRPKFPPIEATYTAAAERGSVRAQAALGFLLLRNHPEAGLRWLAEAAEQGDVPAQIALADALRERGRSRDAAYWYGRASDASPRAGYVLGTMYEAGEGVDQNYSIAVSLYGAAALRGIAEAENRLGNLYMIGGGVRQDYNEARRWYLRAAAKGCAEALINLAGLFFHGVGVEKDVPVARAWALAARRAHAPEADDILRVIDSRGD